MKGNRQAEGIYLLYRWSIRLTSLQYGLSVNFTPQERYTTVFYKWILFCFSCYFVTASAYWTQWICFISSVRLRFSGFCQEIVGAFCISWWSWLRRKPWNKIKLLRLTALKNYIEIIIFVNLKYFMTCISHLVYHSFINDNSFAEKEKGTSRGSKRYETAQKKLNLYRIINNLSVDFIYSVTKLYLLLLLRLLRCSNNFHSSFNRVLYSACNIWCWSCRNGWYVISCCLLSTLRMCNIRVEFAFNGDILMDKIFLQQLISLQLSIV